tara:strand:+ start:246 stop:638 length:393 start_codon:yes stop_codon:yes gene_type:complete
MKKLTTPLEIKEEIVKMLQVERVHFKGKLPFSIKDLPKRYTMPSHINAAGKRIPNKYWTKARTKISNNKRPSRNKQKFDTKVCETIEPRQEHVEIKDIKLTLMLSHDMSARAFIDFITMVEKAGAKVFSV